MGKNKQGQRTKNNVRPSSSGRSAEMLGTAPLNPFMSFSSLKESMGIDEQQIDPSVDPNFQLVLKKMNKKDATTKLKALQEFSQLCDASEAEAIVAILPFWPRLYSVLAVDVEHRVREAAHVAQRSVVTRVKRNLAPYLKQLVGPWFVAQCDPHAPAASAATRAFSETFPPPKLAEAIAFCQEEILNYIKDNLIIHTPQSLCNSKTMTTEEMEGKYIRTVISSLQGYGLYLRSLSQDQLRAAESLNRQLITDKKFWKFAKHQSPQVRSAWFGMLIPLCQQATFLIIGEESRVALAVFGALDDTDATVMTTVWEATLMALLSLDDLWSNISFEKLVLPKLLRVCREAGKGAASAIFPSLLPLLSKMPSVVTGDTHTFYHKLFRSLRQGLGQRSVQQSRSESQAVAKTFVECLQYVVRVQQEDEKLCEDLVLQHLLPTILSSLVEPSWRAYVSTALHSSTSNLLHMWGHAPDKSIQHHLLSLTCNELNTALCSIALQCECTKYLTDLSNLSEGVHGADSVSSEPEVASDSNTLAQDDDISENLEKEELNKPPVKMSRPVEIKNVLHAQVKLIGSLLGTYIVPQQVRFSDQDTEQSKQVLDTRSERTSKELHDLGTSLCCCYLKAARDMAACHYLLPLSDLAKLLDSSLLYKRLAEAVTLPNEHSLFPSLLAQWLNRESALFCRSVMTFVTLLFRHLPEEDHKQLLNYVLKGDSCSIDVDLMLWLLEEITEEGGPALSLIRDSKLETPLCGLTAEAITSADIMAWQVLYRGSAVASDGYHVFSHASLQKILKVIDEQLQKAGNGGDDMPSWLASAAGIMVNLYSEQSPFLRTFDTPIPPLTAPFKLCLRPNLPEQHKSILSNVWRTGAEALAHVHGATSHIVMDLCASFRDIVSTEVLALNDVPMSTLKCIASQVSDYITVVANSVDEPEKRAQVCALLILNAMLKLEPRLDGKLGDLRTLAWCALALRSGAAGCFVIPSGSQMGILSMGRWSFLITSVLQEIISPSHWSSFCDLTFLADEIHLHTRIKLIVDQLSSSELACALSPLSEEVERMMKELLANLTHSDCINVRNLLLCPEERIRDPSVERGLLEHTHKSWHTLFSEETPLESCEYCVSSMKKVLPPSDGGILSAMDLETLDIISEHIRLDPSNPEVQEQAPLWLITEHNLQLHRQRLLLNSNVQTCVNYVPDTVRLLTFFANVVEHLPQKLASHHWDQIMIALASWIHSAHLSVIALEEDNAGAHLPDAHLPVYSFLCGVCRLFVSLQNALEAVRDDRLQLGPAPEGKSRLEETLPTEWKDVFAGECEHKLLAIWARLVEDLGALNSVSPILVAVLDELGWALQHVTTSFLVASPGAPVSYEPLLNLLRPHLLHGLGTVRLASYHLLLKIVPHMVQSDAKTLAAVSTQAESGEVPAASAEQLNLPQFEDVLMHSQTIVTAMLGDVRLGASCTVQPFTDTYSYTSGYLLIWTLIFEMCAAAETELRYQYATWLKSGKYGECLMNTVFRLLPAVVLQHTDSKKRKLADLFETKPKLAFRAGWSSADLEQLACHVFRAALGRLPALARQWWTDAEPKAATLIERVVMEHISPLLCSEEMAAVGHQQDKAVDNMVVRVHPAVREVVATYTVDDLTMELVVRLPSNHPLSPMSVEVGKRNAAAAVQWRQWLLQLTMFLTHQNGSLWDGLALWRNNVVRRYEGVEECYICFCVLSGANYQLPKLSCRTCRKKFHNTCLYKWFQTSNKSTCPICRNLF